jgi:hypothetical protein
VIRSISMEIPDNIEIRSLPIQQSTTELLKVSDSYVPLQREGLLTKRRALKQALVKFNSCSTLYVQGLLTNLDLRDILMRYAIHCSSPE